MGKKKKEIEEAAVKEESVMEPEPEAEEEVPVVSPAFIVAKQRDLELEIIKKRGGLV